ncbi:restriction endonuclease subunit S [Rikenella microfusus]|uniref:restriction endonuclease subunit S n=1 Tax=Rikenella microfusus TaxID=28139 RepID=UPI00266FFDAE|nr:restriction endonuclease subunit S [Rikenella microfusus]
MELKKIHISDIGKVVTGKTPRTSIVENYGGDIPFLTPSDDLSYKSVPKTGKTLTEQGLNEVKNCLLPPHSVCVSCIGSDLGKVVMTSEPTITNQQFNSIIPNRQFDADFVYYLMTLAGKELNYLSKTSTAVPIINKSSFSNYEVEVPDLDTQEKIASILSSLDSKIELNRRINDNLEQQAQALFDYYFDDESKYLENSTMGFLTDIAVYLNGLAMQKFPATDIEQSLPVLKIRELGQRKCDDSSDRCSNTIDTDYVIDNGDIIFSWSGTLLVDVWCGGKCGLNQHLFKVSPLNNYPQWFVYYWTNRHLRKFKLIAKDKAVTMGHIRRSDLENAEVKIPSKMNMQEINARIAPLFQSIIKRRLESSKLEKVRDTLLPKLMSGELKMSEIEIEK